MPYGRMTAHMEEVLRAHIAGLVVWDFGAGDGYYARRMLALGARGVVAVEKEETFEAEGYPPNLCWLTYYFKNVPPPNEIAVAFVSWPVNNSESMRSLLPHLKVARKIVYLGKNDDATACGSPELFEFFTTLTVESEVADSRNDMIVYRNENRPAPLGVL